MTLEFDDILESEKSENLSKIHAVRVTEDFKREIMSATEVFGEKKIAEVFRRVMRNALTEVKSRMPEDGHPV